MSTIVTIVEKAKLIKEQLETYAQQEETIVGRAIGAHELKEIDELLARLDKDSPNNEEQRTAVFEIVKGKLLKLFTDGRQLGTALEYLNEEQRTAVFEIVKDKLPELFTDGWQLGAALWYLNEEQRTTVLEAVKDMLPTLISHARQLAGVLRSLNGEQCIAVFKGLNNSPPELIANGLPLAIHLLCFEGEVRRTAVFEGVKDMLPTLIADVLDLAYVLCVLNEEQCTTVLEGVKDKLPTLIADVLNLVLVLRVLNEEQRTAVLEAVKDMLPTFIPHARQLALVLQSLNGEQCIKVFNGLNNSLPTIIADGRQLAAALSPLNAMQRSLLVDALSSTNYSRACSIDLQRVLQAHTDTSLIRTYVFRQRLNQLDKKRETLDKEGATDKASAASRLYQGVNAAYIQYLQSNHRDDAYNRFKQESTRLIDEAKKSVLKDHRGWKTLLANLLIGVLSLGTAFIANTIYTRGKHTFFEVNTDSVNTINWMQDTLNSI